MKNIVLASTSPYRQLQLKQLNIPFTTDKPNCDETPQQDETAEDLVLRLAQNKAHSVASQFPEHFIIGSDQVACFDGEIIGKPHTVEKALQQLSRFSDHTVTFYTGLSVFDSCAAKAVSEVVTTKVTFRKLTQQEIQQYIAIEAPLNCAGSFKSEGLGCTLFERVESADPSALIGLPMIALARLTRQLQKNLLDAAMIN